MSDNFSYLYNKTLFRPPPSKKRQRVLPQSSTSYAPTSLENCTDVTNDNNKLLAELEELKNLISVSGVLSELDNNNNNDNQEEKQ